MKSDTGRRGYHSIVESLTIFKGGADLLYVVEVDPEDEHDEEGNRDEDGHLSRLHSEVCRRRCCKGGGHNLL